MATEFEPNEIFIYGPEVVPASGSLDGVTLVLQPGDPTVVVRGRLPFLRALDTRPAQDNEHGIKVTPSRFMRTGAVELCGGSMVEAAIQAASSTENPKQIEATVKSLLNFVKGTILIV